MNKIPTMFVRNHDTHVVVDEVSPGCEWASNGEGTPTFKWDGQCTMVRRGCFFARRELAMGKPVPEGFEACGDPDPITGKTVGWVPVVKEDPSQKWLWAAWSTIANPGIEDGTYEAVGPHFNGNRHGLPNDGLRRHGDIAMKDFPASRTYGDIRSYFLSCTGDVEGVVFHHPDGRLCKIKARDFDAKRK